MDEALRHYSHNRMRPIVEYDALSDDFNIASEVRPPKTIADYRHGLGSGAVVVLREVAPQKGNRAHDLEVPSGHHPRIEALGLAGTRDGNWFRPVAGHLIEDVIPFPPVAEIRIRGPGITE